MSDFTIRVLGSDAAPYDPADIVGEIRAWIHYNFPRGFKRDELTAVAGLAEEVGEVSQCAVKMRQGIRGSEAEWKQKLAKELGDVFVKLVDVADFYYIDPLAAIEDRWRTVRERDWVTDSIQHGQGEER